MPRSAARESQQPAEGDSLLSTLVQASPLAIYLLDPDGVVQLWNPAAERIFGWSEHAVLGQRDPTVASADHELDLLIQTVLSSTEPVEREVVRFNRWAEPIEIALSATRVLDSAGHVRGIMAIAADITERRRIERERDHLLDCERDARERAEAAEARARFLAQGSALLDGSLDYLATLNNLARLAVPYLADYCLIDELEDDCVSRVAVAHVDPEREQLLQREAREPLSGSPEKHPVLRVMLTGKSVLMEEVDEAALGDISHDEEHLARLRQLDLHSYLVVPLETGGRILGAVTLAYAQSRRRYSPADMAMAEELARRAATAVEAARLYRQSRLAVQARERLLAIVSHDLRNSLATVLLNASAILESKRADSLDRTILEQLQWIARSAEQMNRMISDLLDLSAIELGRLTLEPSRQSTLRLVDDAAQMYAALALEKQITLQVHAPTDPPDILADAGRIQQVLGNLLTNAIKFSGPGATVVLRAIAGNGEVRFDVMDNGPGVEPEHLATIFERYWQGRRGRRGGAGLGLGIAKAIVDGHGGRIWVESKIGEGSTFSFTVPQADPSAPRMILPR